MRRPLVILRPLLAVLAYMFVMSAFEAVPSATARGGFRAPADLAAQRVPGC